MQLKMQGTVSSSNCCRVFAVRVNVSSLQATQGSVETFGASFCEAISHGTIFIFELEIKRCSAF